jgi:hypothetical protein
MKIMELLGAPLSPQAQSKPHGRPEMVGSAVSSADVVRGTAMASSRRMILPLMFSLARLLGLDYCPFWVK